MRHENTCGLYWWQSYRYCESYCCWFVPFLEQANVQVQLEIKKKWGCTIFSFKFSDHLKSVHKVHVRNLGLVPHQPVLLSCCLIGWNPASISWDSLMDKHTLDFWCGAWTKTHLALHWTCRWFKATQSWHGCYNIKLDLASLPYLISGQKSRYTYSFVLRKEGRKWRRTKEPLDQSKRGEWKSWLKAQHSEN